MSEQISDSKVPLVVPAFNEEASLAATLEDIKDAASFATVLVVDDGSHDETAKVAQRCGANYVRLPFNLGVGPAVQTGFKYAQRNGFGCVVQFDGDGQHRAEYVERLVTRIQSAEADVAAGVRSGDDLDAYTFSLLRGWGSRWLRFLIWLASGRMFSDPTCGLRAFNRRSIAYLAETYPEVAAEPYSLVMLTNRGFNVVEEPIRLRKRTGGSTSLTFGRAISYMVIASWAIVTAALAGRRA